MRPETPPINHDYISSDLDCDEYTFSNYDRIISNFVDSSQPHFTWDNSIDANCFIPTYTHGDSVSVDHTDQNVNLTDSIEGIPANISYIGLMRPETPPINHDYISSDLDCDEYTFSNYDRIISNFVDSSQPHFTWDNSIDANCFIPTYTHGDSVSVDHTDQNVNLTDSIEGIPANISYIGLMRPETPPINHDYISSDLDCDEYTFSNYDRIISNFVDSSQPHFTWDNSIDANCFIPTYTHGDSVSVDHTDQNVNLTDSIEGIPANISYIGLMRPETPPINHDYISSDLDCDEYTFSNYDRIISNFVDSSQPHFTWDNSIDANCFIPTYTHGDSVSVDHTDQNVNLTDSIEGIPANISYIGLMRPETPPINHDYISSDLDCDEYTFSNYDRIISNFVDSSQPHFTWDNSIDANCFIPTYTHGDSVSVDHTDQNVNLTDSIEGIPANISYIGLMRPETPPINHDYISSDLDCDEYTFSNYDRIISNFVDSSQPHFTWDNSIDANCFIPTYTHGDSVSVDHTDQNVNLTDSIEGIPANISYIGLMRPETPPINHDYISSDLDCDEYTFSNYDRIISNFVDSSQPHFTWDNSIDANCFIPTYTHGDSVSVDHTDQNVNLTDSIEGIPANISYIGLMRPETPPINHDYISSDLDCDEYTFSNYDRIISNFVDSSQPHFTWDNSIDANCFIPTYTHGDSVSVDHTDQNVNLTDSIEGIPANISYIGLMRPETPPINHDYISSDLDCDEYTFSNYDRIISNFVDSSQPHFTWDNSIDANCFIPTYTHGDSVSVDHTDQNVNLTDSIEGIPANISYIGLMRPETPPINHDYISSDLDCDEYTFSNYDRIISNFVDSSQPNYCWDTSIEANSFSPTYTNGDSVAVDHTDQNVNLTDSIEGIPATLSYIGLMRPETPPINHDYILSDSDCDDFTCSSDGLLIPNSANSSQPNDTRNNSVEANSKGLTCIQNNATVAYNNDGNLYGYTHLNIENNKVIKTSRKCHPRLVTNRRTNTSRLNRIMMKNNIKLHISESGKRTIIRNVSKTTTKNTKNIHAKRRKPFSSKFIHG
ncbi:hypothetical protein RF11_06656 [Thelohanellus kitauei]|uniref:Uncharacterized protein n=1 Tax=Thelohanellus kitauei TaxID=669202 RepID=A0A0C2MCE9_THEKT|nr:hypothetical protein RF11_06656 [Thelohanellus kitauei]